MIYLTAYFALILLHELGHIIAAKIFKVHIMRITLFFSKGRSLLQVKIATRYIPVSIRKYVQEHTYFELGWLPFGGYVQLKGTQRYEGIGSFWGKPLWQQVLVAGGGIIVNLVIAFSLVIFGNGNETLIIIGLMSLVMGIINSLPIFSDGRYLRDLLS